MLVISIFEVPKFLHKSAFYSALSDQNIRVEFEVPEEYYADNDKVESFSDFCRVLRVLNYWGAEYFPISLISFCDTKNYATWCRIAEITLKDHPQLFADLAAMFAKPINLASKIIRSMQMGRIDFLEYFAECDAYSDSLSPTTFACSLGRVDYLTILHKYRFSWDKITCIMAAKHGSLDCLMFAHKHGCRWGSGVISEAAEHGFYECMQYALENVCPIGRRSCTYAAGGGHLDCLHLLYCHGAPWNSETATAAAAGGHLECLAFLYDKDCPWNENVIDAAALNGHRNCLLFALERGCEVGPNACVLAASAGHLHCWRILHDHRDKLGLHYISIT